MRRKVLLAAMCATLLAGVLSAETFYLKQDKSQRTLGPYEFKSGTRIIVDKTPYTLIRTEEKEPPLRQKLRRIIIPELSFKDGDVRDVVELLSSLGRDADVAEANPARKGVNLVLRLGDTQPPTVTLNARYVSMMEAIVLVSELTGMQYQVRENYVMLFPRGDAQSEMPQELEPPKGSDILLEKLGRITIPEMEFRQATIHQIAAFLVQASRDADKDENNPGKKGINIVVSIGNTQPGAVTCAARSVNLHDAIRIVTAASGLTYRLVGNCVIVVPLLPKSE